MPEFEMNNVSHTQPKVTLHYDMISIPTYMCINKNKISSNNVIKYTTLNKMNDLLRWLTDTHNTDILILILNPWRSKHS